MVHMPRAPIRSLSTHRLVLYSENATCDRRKVPQVTRVALVDDHEIVALALEPTIAATPGFTFLGVATTVDGLLTAFPDVELVILDLRLADGSSPISNVEKLTNAGASVVAFTSGENPYLVRLVANTAVLGIVRKSAPLSVLIDTLTQAAARNPVMSAEWAAAIDSDPSLDDAKLSAQEQRVLTLFSTGLKTQAVASSMGIAVATVEDYIRRIRVKYGKVGRPAHTKVDLYKRAIEDGFLPLPSNGL